MTARHAALVRGINVGRGKRVAMTDLRGAVEDLGGHSVRTLLNSGNVVYTLADPKKPVAAPALRERLRERTKVDARFIVLDAEAFAAVVADNTLAAQATDPTRLMAAVFLDEAPDAALGTLAAVDHGREAFAVGSRAAYLWCPDGISVSPLMEQFGRAVRDTVTVRNWATILKIAAVMRE